MIQLSAHAEGFGYHLAESGIFRGFQIENQGSDLFDIGWNSIVLDPYTRACIKANTVDFLKQSRRWAGYNIPLKRGVLLTGEPGTGKTIICRALMSEAAGITCITTNAYYLHCDEYICYLYELAEDLSPCIVFIEDIDLIGQNRMEFGYQNGASLLSLLSAMDGIEEKKNIVTVATTNCLEILDRALSRRPSRFDLVINVAPPSLEQRRELIRLICRQIPLEEQLQNYIALRTGNFTPAQIQEIIFGLVILHPAGQDELTFSCGEVDMAISRLIDKSRCRVGFNTGENHNGAKNDLAQTVKLV
jgi:cell division protease FtsH